MPRLKLSTPKLNMVLIWAFNLFLAGVVAYLFGSIQ